ETIGERTAFALQHKKSNRVLFNHEPYGFDRVDYKLVDGKKVGGRLVENVKEQKIAREVIALRQASQNPGAPPSFRYLASMLNSRGVPTKRGGKWYASTVSNVVNNRKLYE